jgi:enterochelin esterase-like enzyme
MARLYNPRMRQAILWIVLVCSASATPRFDIRLSPSAVSSPVDGRIILIVSKDPEGEPRFHVSWDLETQQIFGLDVDGWRPGDIAHIDGAAAGYPLRGLSDLPPGAYHVQAVLNVYETVHRADGHVLKLHMDRGEGQEWNRSPGNLMSKPQQVQVGPDSVVSMEMTETIPPIEPPKDTKYIRHVAIESKLLTQFWGRPTKLSAIVLVPEGFDDNPLAHYPIAFDQGHFPADFRAFRETPPPAESKGVARQRANRAYQFFQDWTSGRLPKMLIVLTQHPTPYYDDSYGVNTANMGPYGDALTQELYPFIEKQFRAIGEPWARVVYGGSTGGWMTLAQQIFYPDYFGGAWGFCPDPVDFHAFQLINVYSDKNAYYDLGPFLKLPRPLGRLPNDHTLNTSEDFSRQESVLGAHGRSGGQMDAFHAVFGPVGPDGYPAKLWDAETGAINPEVARYWEEHYDLTAMLRRDWEKLGPKLIGKLHITIGTKDTFYLDAAVHLAEDFLENTKLPGQGPYYGGSVGYGNNEPHCWPGKIPAGQSLETYYLPIFASHMRKMAPKGADVESWMR